MEEYAEALESGAMPEAKFIEENLWLSLEAVFLSGRLKDKIILCRLAVKRCLDHLDVPVFIDKCI